MSAISNNKEEKNIFDKEAIDQFLKDVLQPILPNARYESINYFGAADIVRASSIGYNLSSLNEINADSSYFYKGIYSLVHYTSVKTLLNIIKEKKIRLYDLSGMDDTEEFEQTFEHTQKSISRFEIDKAKKKIFCLSMCKEELEENKESLPQWRTYAQDGNGVGIVLSFNKKFAKQWVNFNLSKVYYNKKDLDKFIELEERYHKFSKKYSLTISNFSKMFFRYFAFHKNNIYKSEKEVRLIYSEGFRLDQLQTNFKYDLSKSNKKTRYIELELEWAWDEKSKKQLKEMGLEAKQVLPYISIDKVILGYRLSKEQIRDIKEVCNTYLKNYKEKPEFVESSLSSHFIDKLTG